MKTSSILTTALALATFAACAPKENAATADSAAAPPIAAAPAPEPTTVAPGTLVDPNAATREEIAALPGMDAALADSLVAKRPFADMRAVNQVLAARLSETQRDTLYTRLFLPLDLNAATKEEIELIPGVGARMSREFEEYRPYDGLPKFRREIGKYVDSTEVARLEKYVRIR